MAVMGACGFVLKTIFVVKRREQRRWVQSGFFRSSRPSLTEEGVHSGSSVTSTYRSVFKYARAASRSTGAVSWS